MRSFIPLVFAALVSCGDVPSEANPPATQGGADQDLFDRTVYAGNVGVQTFDDDVVVWLDGGANGQVPDATADHVFVLQRQGPVDAPPAMLVERARVVATRSEVVISSSAGETVLRLRIDGEGGPMEASGAVRESIATARGYGLSRRSGAWVLATASFTESQLRDVAAGCGRAPTARGNAAASLIPNCWSGGEGALSCTTPCIGMDSCSVSCATGSYACCDNTRCPCTCVAIDKARIET